MTGSAVYAAVLRSGGIGKGDRVAILAQNSVLYLEALFAVIRAGAALVPLNYRLIGRELVAILEDADVKALLFTEEFRDRVGQIRPSLPGIGSFVRIDDPELSKRGGDDAPDPSPPVLETDIAMVIYEGGISSRPRGAMLSHRNLLAASASSALELSLSRNDVFLSCAYLPFLGGTGRLMRFLYVGATIVLQPEFDPEEALRAIERRSVTRVLLTPTMMAQILAFPSAGKFNLSTLRTVLYGGAVIPLDLLKRAIRFFRCGLVQSHGQLESTGLLTVLHEEDHSLDESTPYMRKLMSVGKEAIGVEVRVVDEDGREIGPNEVGEIVARGPNVFEGYRNDPALTAGGPAGRLAPDGGGGLHRRGWVHLRRRPETGHADGRGDLDLPAGDREHPLRAPLREGGRRGATARLHDGRSARGRGRAAGGGKGSPGRDPGPLPAEHGALQGAVRDRVRRRPPAERPGESAQGAPSRPPRLPTAPLITSPFSTRRTLPP